MFQIDVMSRTPVYEQLVNQVERFVLLGILGGNDQVPSVRALSAELSVNPNTIQKAISELDRRGLVYSVPGRGCFIKPEAKEILKSKKRKELPVLRDKLKELRVAGIEKQEICDLVDEVYGKGENV